MRKITLIVGLLLISFLELKAQKKYEFTVTEAVQFALQNVNDIKNLRVDRKIQDAKNKELTGQALPQLNGTLSAQYYFNIPVMMFPDFVTPQVYGVLQDEGVKNGSGSPIIKPDEPMKYFPAQFGVPWQASAGFAFQQLLFQPDVFVGLQARSTALKFADMNIQVMEDSVKSNVYRSYYAVLIAEKRKVFLVESIQRLEKLLSDQNKLYQNGFAEKLDIDKTTVSLNNLRTSNTQTDNFIYVGYASLKYALGLGQRDTLMLRDTLNVDFVKRDVLDAANFRYEDRSEIRMLTTLKELQTMDVRRYKLSYLPTVAAFWNYSANAMRQKLTFFNPDEPWFKSSYVGLNINVPIFDGMQKHYRIRQAQYNLEKTANNLENMAKVIDLQREAALNIFKNSLSTLDMQERNMQLAERVYFTTKKKYESGLGSSFEVLQADTDFQTAQSNFFQALYDAATAKIGYYRSLGKL
ncbi:TolC family protein [Pollutibacter soli]|uniref:TolC family protein n=1 Tax=Pollutibacter soli TaxID=3034157 RepID=UPI003013D34B